MVKESLRAIRSRSGVTMVTCSYGEGKENGWGTCMAKGKPCRREGWLLYWYVPVGGWERSREAVGASMCRTRGQAGTCYS